MQPSSWLYSFLQRWEQLELTAYLPTPNDVPTIGYGHTRGVKLGDTCTAGEALAWLRGDVQWASDCVSKAVTVPVNQNEYDALCSLCFNIGASQFVSSTLLKLLNNGEYSAAAAEFPKWDRQHGTELKGLKDRRLQEQARFLTPDATVLVA